VVRAVRRHGPRHLATARRTVAAITLVAVDETALDAAGMLDPPRLRTLDAIHLAAALALGDSLEGFVTYDARLADAAITCGLPVAAPAP